MTEEVVIRAQGLTKRYGATIAVDHIDLDVRAGEIVGILGPNGSGKTTTILMLLGLTEPTEGRAEVAGFDPLRDPLEVKRRVGYLPDSIGFYDGLSARDNLAYTGRLAGLSRREIDQRFTETLARVGLPDVGRNRVATFSRGMRQRLGLAEVLMKRPSIAILDEPTATLDPHSTQEFLGMIRGLKADGTAVLLSSHHLDQVQSVCDRVALFNRGRIALSGSVTELAHRVLGGGYVIDVEARGDAVRNQLAAVPGVVRVQVLAPELYRVDCKRDLRAEIARHLAPSFDLLGIRFAEPSLNEVYTRYFDEVRRRTLSRVLAQPIYRDALLLGKFLAGLVALAIGLFSLWLLTIGLGLLLLGLPPNTEEMVRMLGFLVATIAYGGVWLAVAFLFSVVFRAPATAALAALGVWLLFSLFWSVVTPLVATLIAGPPEGIFGPNLDYLQTAQVLDRISPNTLYAEIALALLQPATRALGPVLYSQVPGALLGAPLPAAQSFILVWPQMTGLVAGMIVIFAIAYVVFQRQEIRA